MSERLLPEQPSVVFRLQMGIDTDRWESFPGSYNSAAEAIAAMKDLDKHSRVAHRVVKITTKVIAPKKGGAS